MQQVVQQVAPVFWSVIGLNRATSLRFLVSCLTFSHATGLQQVP
jgi:hypothetical protein